MKQYKSLRMQGFIIQVAMVFNVPVLLIITWFLKF